MHRAQGQDRTHTNSPGHDDIVISVDDSRTSPLLSPAHLRIPDEDAPDPFANVTLPEIDREASPLSQVALPIHHNHNGDFSNNNDSNSPSQSNDSNGSNGSNGSPEFSFQPQEVLRPLSPPHLPSSPPMDSGSDPIATFRYQTPSVHGDYTPSVRSLRLPLHQQSNRPYTPSNRNDYPLMMGQHHPHQHHLHHHPQHQHHHYQQHRAAEGRDSGKAMVIDYAGLDASVAEASLIENGFHQSAFLPSEGKEGVERQNVARAASTGSVGVFGIGPNGTNEFRRRSARKASFYSERAPRPPLPESLRYTFFSKTQGMIQAPTIPQILVKAKAEGCPGPEGPTVFSDLLKDGCFWLDILDPSDFDMQILAKHFHVHPLTIEDISTEEVREKYEVFRHYYFVCFRTFDQDYNSGSYLQPASMYCVVFRDGIITFHFRPTTHHLNVLRRMEQLQSHITLTPDWINYALLDDISDGFASPIQTIEYEVDSIDELVLLLRENETTDMLRRIGSCRKNVMAMARLLANKADVIRGLMKRFDDRYAVAPLASSSNVAATTTTNTAATSRSNTAHHSDPLDSMGPTRPSSRTEQYGDDATGNTTLAGTGTGAGTGVSGGPTGMIQMQHYRDGEILLYLGDILDHVLTMLQSLSSYEKILDRSHSNYLAQISLEINQLSNKTNEVVGTLTFLASIIVPMTFISGLWGMNIQVPGQADAEGGESLTWWWCLLGFMLLYCIVAVILGRRFGLI